MNFPIVSFATLFLITVCYGAHVSMRGPDARAGEPEPPVTPGPDSQQKAKFTGAGEPEPPVTPGPDSQQKAKFTGAGEPEPPVTPGPDSVTQQKFTGAGGPPPSPSFEQAKFTGAGGPPPSPRFEQANSTDNLVHSQWQNEYDRLLRVECPDQEGIYQFKSIHDNGPEDRVFEFNCRRTAKTNIDDSYWTDFVNGYKLPAMFQCNPNYFLCGIESVHDDGSEDRIFKYKCCHAEFHFTMNCGFTGDLNEFDWPIDYSTSGSQVLTGMFSYHDTWSHDRKFRVGYCEYKSCQGSKSF